MTTSDLALPPWFGVAATALICGLAIWKGRWPERTAGVAFVLAWPLTLLLRDYSFSHPQWGGLAVDVMLLALLAFIALRSSRNWALWAAAFQMLGVVTHAARIVDSSVGAWAYITAGVIWTYLVMATLAVGVGQCIRRRERVRFRTATALQAGSIDHE